MVPLEQERKRVSLARWGSCSELALKKYVSSSSIQYHTHLSILLLQLKIDQRVFLSPSKRKIEVNIVQSNFHIEITPRFNRQILSIVWKLRTLEFFSEAGNYDRVVIQELLKEIAQTQQVDLNAKQRFKGLLSLANIQVGLTGSQCSGDHQRSRLPIERCTSSSPTNDGKIHVKYAYHSLRQ